MYGSLFGPLCYFDVYLSSGYFCWAREFNYSDVGVAASTPTMRSLSILTLRLLVTAVAVFEIFPISVAAQVQTDLSHDFEFEQVFSIGDDESAPPEYLFRKPEHIRTDADGRIYVAEGQGFGSPPGRNVRVFGPDGDFLGALGRPGGGPGEYRDIQAIAIDSQNRLVVYDARLDRFTRYAPFETFESFPLPDDERIETIPNPKKHRLSPAFMYGLPNGHVVLYYQGAEGERAADQPRMHVYDDSFAEVQAFGTPSDWNLPDDKFVRYLLRSPGPMLIGGSHSPPRASSLVVAPTPYRGLLYRYARDASGAWSLQRLEGRDPGRPTHEVLESPPESFDDFVGIYTSDGIGARLHSRSNGLGQFNDGRIVHLSSSKNEDGIMQPHLELFGPGGELQNAGRIESLAPDDPDSEPPEDPSALSLEWVDRRNRLYLVDRRSGFPTLRVMTLDE